MRQDGECAHHRDRRVPPVLRSRRADRIGCGRQVRRGQTSALRAGGHAAQRNRRPTFRDRESGEGEGIHATTGSIDRGRGRRVARGGRQHPRFLPGPVDGRDRVAGRRELSACIARTCISCRTHEHWAVRSPERIYMCAAGSMTTMRSPRATTRARFRLALRLSPPTATTSTSVMAKIPRSSSDFVFVNMYAATNRDSAMKYQNTRNCLRRVARRAGFEARLHMRDTPPAPPGRGRAHRSNVVQKLLGHQSPCRPRSTCIRRMRKCASRSTLSNAPESRTGCWRAMTAATSILAPDADNDGDTTGWREFLTARLGFALAVG